MTLFPNERREETVQGVVESLVYQSNDGFFSVEDARPISRRMKSSRAFATLGTPS